MIYQKWIMKKVSEKLNLSLNVKWKKTANATPDQIAYKGKYTVFYQTVGGDLIWSVNGNEYTVNSYSAYGVVKGDLNHTGLFITEEYAKDIGASRAVAAKRLDKEFKSILKERGESGAVVWMQKFMKKYEARFLSTIYCRGRISGNGMKLSYWEDQEKVFPVLANHIKFFLGKGLLKENAKIYCDGEEANHTTKEILDGALNVDVSEKNVVNDFIRDRILKRLNV